MSCTQITACQLTINLKDRYHSSSVPRTHVSLPGAYINVSRLSLSVASRALNLRRRGPVCLFGDKGKSGSTNEGSPWNALEKAMGNFKKEPSVEELLKQQIAKKDFYKDEGNIGGGSGRGGDRAGGGGGGFGEPEDEDFSGVKDEILQVVLATLGFVFLYIYIIDGEDITALAKDFLKFIFTGRKSIRLGRVFYGFSRFIRRFTYKPEVQEDWLECAIINTPTWYDGPDKYRHILSSSLGSRAVDSDDEVAPRYDDNEDDQSNRYNDEEDDQISRSYDDDDDV